MFSHLDAFPGDPILGLNEAFKNDPRPHKVNPSIGIYFGDDGKVPLLETVREAEAQLLREAASKPYLPMEGPPALRDATARLLFGEDAAVLAQGRVATVQTIGSSSAIKLAAEFIKRWYPGSHAWVSDPTWDNHRAIFEGAGVPVHAYPYYDARSRGLSFEAMLDSLDALPPRSVVVLHGGCHNPTGVDLSRQQWQALIPVLVRRDLLPLVDLAYQGYGEGLEEDAYPLRAMAAAGSSFMVANSFSKNMSLYAERAGALSVVAPDAAQAQRVLGQLQAFIRRHWSNPPMHASGIVTKVLTDTALRAHWSGEVEAMRRRILDMRAALHEQLARQLPGRDFSYLLTQRGMFSYTGLTPEQVDRLRNEHAVYLIRSGRLCVAGLNTDNVPAVARAIAAVSA